MCPPAAAPPDTSPPRSGGAASRRASPQAPPRRGNLSVADPSGQSLRSSLVMTRRGLLGRLSGLGAVAAAAACGSPGGSTPVPAPGVPPAVRVSYGSRRDQYAELHLPAGAAAVPVVVVLHGGFWRQRYRADLGTPLAADLANRGYAAWNLEYRRVGGAGGWPGTFADVAAGIDALAEAGQRAAVDRLDLSRVVAVGHSAGGHLAVWAAGRPRVPAGSPGAVPAVPLVGAVSQAGVLDLVTAARAGLGAGAVQDLLGGSPDTVPERYAAASPTALAPLGVPVVCVHGRADDVVPLRQSELFAAVDPRAEVVVLPETGHFELIDPEDPAWGVCRDAAVRLLRRGAAR